VVRNINLENVTCEKSKYGLLLRAYPRSPVTDVRLKNCTFKNVGKSNVLEGVKNLQFHNVKINDEIFNKVVTQ
jgi:unsaturated rhamnogalacturonyl hydrolase